MKSIIFIVLVAFLPIQALEIRTPIASEIEEVADLYYRAWHDAFDVLLPYLSSGNSPKKCLKKWQIYSRADDQLVFLVACVDNTIVGVVLASLYKSHSSQCKEYDCIINKLYILPEYKRQGIGKALFFTALHTLRHLGFKKVLLKSYTSNENANFFYEKMGGVLVKQSKFMYKDTLNIYGFDLLTL